MKNQIKNLTNALEREGWNTWRESLLELPFGLTGCVNCKKDNYDVAIMVTMCGVDIEICQLINDDVVNEERLIGNASSINIEEVLNDIKDYIKRI